MDLVTLSPYITRGPVPKNMFFGRELEIKSILQQLEDSSITIVGGRRIGKTSILHRIDQILSEENKRQVVYLDCQAVGRYTDLFSMLAFEIKAALSGSTPQHFLKFLEHLQNKHPDKPLVFLFDEIDALLTYDRDNNETLFKLFRSLSQTNHCRFIFCGERGLYTGLRDPVSPFFNFGQPIFLRYLDPQTVKQIIVEPMTNLGLTLHQADELARRIYHTTGGRPNIVQYLCHRLIEAIAPTKRRTIAPADLTAIQTGYDFFEYFLEVVWGTLNPLEKFISILIQTDEFTFKDVERWLETEGLQIGQQQISDALDNLALYAILKRQNIETYALTAVSLPEIVRQHNALATLKTTLREEVEQWLKKSSNLIWRHQL